MLHSGNSDVSFAARPDSMEERCEVRTYQFLLDIADVPSVRRSAFE